LSSENAFAGASEAIQGRGKTVRVVLDGFVASLLEKTEKSDIR
jgi:hypothetical protein